MPMPVDLDKLAEILREAAATEIVPRFRNLSPGDIREKTSATDLVTAGDEAAERFIAAECRGRFPNALFVGEESVAADARLLGRLGEAEVAIVVDPIDGTANFAAGMPLFAVMAAVVYRGETIGGIIYDPLGDDMMIAEKGAGAFHHPRKGDSRRLRTAGSLPLGEAIGLISTSYFPNDRKAALLPRLADVKIVSNYRNAGHEYRLLASGGAHFAIYSKAMPWDHLPGALLVTEAGGHVAMSDGTPYVPTITEGTVIAACDADFWQVVRDGLLPADRR